MTPKDAICMYTGYSSSELTEYRYHYGRTGIPIYDMGDYSICCVGNLKKPPASDNYGIEWDWKVAEGSIADHCKGFGKTIWIAKN